jgi:hypothetical protein
MRQLIGSIPSPLNGSIRKVLKLTAAAFSSLALGLCYAGSVSAGSSVTVDAEFHTTFGSPTRALATPDNSYVLVSVTGPQAGVQVFQQSDFTTNPCGSGTQNIIEFPPPKGKSANSVTSVQGMQFLPAPNGVSVGAAVEHQGAEFFSLSDLKTCAIGGKDNVVNVPQPPQQFPSVCSNLGGNCAPGSFDLALTPNGAPGYAFVANEYGLKRVGKNDLPLPGINLGLVGTIGIIKIQRNSAGGFTSGTRSIDQNKYIYVPGGGTLPGVTISHDGKRLYVVTEGAPRNEINKKTGNPYWDPTNVSNTPNGGILASQNCQSGESDSKGKLNIVNNGLLSIIDVDKAERGRGQSSILLTIAAGCVPVRVAETTDGKYIWVAARGLNLNLPVQPGKGGTGYQVLSFDVSKLLSNSLNEVNEALVGFGDSGGTAPVGLALFNNDQMLAVANSNRFFSKLPQPAGDTNVAILDVSNPRTPTVITTIPPTPTSADMFPRDVTLGPQNVGDCLADSGCFTLYVPNFQANMLEVITAQVN